MNSNKNTSFGALFKKYRLRSEIETLAEFGNLLADEGIVYETSLFTRWQRGERVPSERKILLAIIRLFIKKEGLVSIDEVNNFLENANQGYLTSQEKQTLLFKQDESKILQASLGGLLKDYRNQKNISLQELSITLGISNPSILERIESGFEKPKREFLENIFQGMTLKEQEKNNLLLAGSYLPTRTEILNIRKKLEPLLLSWKYPLVILDFGWRVIAQNNQNKLLYNFSSKVQKYIEKESPTILEIQFGPNSSNFKSGKKGWRELMKNLIIHFKAAQLIRAKEDWYLDLIGRLMQNKQFRELWHECNDINPNLLATKFGRKSFEFKKNNLNFDFFVVPVFNDPRFDIQFHTPSNLFTYKYYE